MHYVLKGREAILPTTIKHPDDILWKHNGDKVIAFDSKEEQVFRQYQGRAALAWDTAELTIADVRYEDSGEYELEALVGDRTHRSQFMLKVLGQFRRILYSSLMFVYIQYVFILMLIMLLASFVYFMSCR